VTKHISLVTGGTTQIDDHNYDLFSKYLWYQCAKCRHVIRVTRRGDDLKTVYMAVMVVGGGDGMRVGGACNPCPVPKEHSNG
jgi:hypothetical protein